MHRGQFVGEWLVCLANSYVDGSQLWEDVVDGTEDLFAVVRHVEGEFLQQQEFSFQRLDGLEEVGGGKFDEEGGLGSEIELFEVKWEFVDVS